MKLAGRAQIHQKCCPWGFIWLFNCSVLVCCWGLDTILKKILVTSLILSESFRILLTALRIKISKPWVHLKWFLWLPLLNIPWNIAKKISGWRSQLLSLPPSLSLPSTLFQDHRGRRSQKQPLCHSLTLKRLPFSSHRGMRYFYD